MVDLEKISGLSIKFDEKNNSLVFGEGVKEVKPTVRKLEEILIVLVDKTVKEPKEFYYMFRDVHKTSDEKIIRKNKLRYDITVIPPAIVGKEYIKTSGHYHPLVPNTNLAYPEVYEVFLGTAHYLLQKSLPPFDKVDEVILIEANPGDKVLIQPNYGHITINPKNETLVMSNWMADGLASLYKPYEEKQGGAYYEMVGGEFIPNKNYGEVPKIKIIKPKDFPEFGLTKNIPMYKSFFEDPEQFKFLISPQDFEFEEFYKI